MIVAGGMCRPKGYGFWSRFGLKTGIDFDHYGLNSGMVFKGTERAYKRINFCVQNISFELNSLDFGTDAKLNNNYYATTKV